MNAVYQPARDVMERDLHKAYLQSLDFQTTANDKTKNTKLCVVASGKGGVGKTFISSGLGITLSKLRHSVVIVDLDLSGANVHTSLGLSPSNLNIRHFLEGDKSLQDLLTTTSFPKLSFIQGFWDSWTPAHFSYSQIERLLPQLKNLNADYVIVDIGAGASESHLELFKAADEKFLVTTPEPTSVEKNYRFIESFICHSLKSNATPDTYNSLISTLRDHRQGNSRKPFSFRSYLKNASNLNLNFFEGLSSKPIRLIVNSARSQSNCDLGYSIKSVCNKYYDLNINYTGSTDFDNAVWQAIHCRQHVLETQPFTPLAGQFLSLCKTLIDPEELRALV